MLETAPGPAAVNTSGAPSRWTVVIPYFNERDYLPATLASLLAQDLGPFHLVLVDNASTDGSSEVCRSLLEGQTGIMPVYVHEPRPGKINALECGLSHVASEFVAFCDADTTYPPHYLRRCTEIFSAAPADVAAVMATDLPGAPVRGQAKFRQIKTMVVARLLGKQAHTGGFGLNFRTVALREAGGFSARQWPFILEDHEVMHRIFKHGRSRYDFNLWCTPSGRRHDRTGVSWTLFERLLYHAVPYRLKDWFFYRFLRDRFAARNLWQTKLREKTWQQ